MLRTPKTVTTGLDARMTLYSFSPCTSPLFHHAKPLHVKVGESKIRQTSLAACHPPRNTHVLKQLECSSKGKDKKNHVKKYSCTKRKGSVSVFAVGAAFFGVQNAFGIQPSAKVVLILGYKKFFGDTKCFFWVIKNAFRDTKSFSGYKNAFC